MKHPSERPLWLDYVDLIVFHLQQKHPARKLSSSPHVYPPDVGARNLVVGCGDLVLKWRLSAGTPLDGEEVALKRLPAGCGPALLGRLHKHELLREAALKRDLNTLFLADFPVGDALLMERLKGEALPLPLSDENIEQVAACLVSLHQEPGHDLPRLRLADRPSTILRMILDIWDELKLLPWWHRTLDEAIGNALTQAELHVKEVAQLGRWPRFRQFCHGDLRWHNMRLVDGRVQLLDLEFAGQGDPAMDLAMMTCRTPLSWFDELRLLDAYLARTQDPSFGARYFALRPLVGLLCVGGAILHQNDVARGLVPLQIDALSHTHTRWPALEHELNVALERLRPFEAASTLSLPWPVLPSSTARTQAIGHIAIDGTSCSLKSPLAQALAKALGIPHFNTGLLYRYAALWAWCHELEPTSNEEVRILCDHLQQAPLELLPSGLLQVGNYVLEQSLMLQEVEDRVAVWAAIPAVRASLDGPRQALLSQPEAIIEGRDIGTILIPDASWKIFVDAPIEARAGWLAQRQGCSLEEAKAQLIERDQIDRERESAPMSPARHSLHLQFTPETLDATCEQLVTKLLASLSTPESE